MNWTWRIDGTKEKSPDFSELFSGIDGGEDEDRTHDLRIANAALSQLSYPPTVGRFYVGTIWRSI